MAKKQKNEILEEQKKARQEFLELKKMQHGDMEAPPKPSEVAVMPKTRKEKWENFCFHYKWHMIVIAALTVILAVIITQCATKKRYDIEVVLFSQHLIMDDQADKMADYLSHYTKDINGDGEVNVNVINCSFEKDGGSVQHRNTMLTRLQALISGDEKALLFITDEDAADYLDEMITKGFFQDEPLAFGEDFYEKIKMEELQKQPEGLQIACRKVENTLIEKKKDVKKQYEAAQKLLKVLKEKQ